MTVNEMRKKLEALEANGELGFQDCRLLKDVRPIDRSNACTESTSQWKYVGRRIILKHSESIVLFVPRFVQCVRKRAKLP